MINPRQSTLEEILTKHTLEQYDILKATEDETDEAKLKELSLNYDAIDSHPVSFIELNVI